MDQQMVFSKEKFLSNVNAFDKRLYSKYLDDMEGREVDFSNKKYKDGEIILSDGDSIYPIYKEWCKGVGQMRLFD